MNWNESSTLYTVAHVKNAVTNEQPTINFHVNFLGKNKVLLTLIHSYAKG